MSRITNAISAYKSRNNRIDRRNLLINQCWQLFNSLKTHLELKNSLLNIQVATKPHTEETSNTCQTPRPEAEEIEKMNSLSRQNITACELPSSLGMTIKNR